MENFSSSRKTIYKLLTNRVNRSYSGGMLIEEWQGLPHAKDGSQPEDWLSSLVEARNSVPIKDEGLSKVFYNNSEIKLIDLIQSDPAFFLGEKHFNKYGLNFSVLTKILDAGVRLSIQVHPTKSFAKKYFNSDFGKTEAWYILGGRVIDDEKPYVLVGFKPHVTKEMWKKYFEQQDIDGMINSLHKFYVQQGDVLLIEGGLPHAIGSGCFLIEIQEPTDLTIRTERRTFDGSLLPDRICHQGLGFEKMLDCFNYEPMSEQETRNKCFIVPTLQTLNKGNLAVTLVSEHNTNCFSMKLVKIEKVYQLNDPSFKTCIIISGSGKVLTSDEGMTPVSQGESFFIPAETGTISFINFSNDLLEIILCYPPLDLN